MAGNRLHKIGSIFTRTEGLLKSEAMKQKDKPKWFDVYKAFPPKLVPTFERTEPTSSIRNIMYPEDLLRAKFYKKFGSVGTIYASEKSLMPSLSQIFIEEYKKIQPENTDFLDDKIFAQVEIVMEQKGYNLQKQNFMTTTKVSQRGLQSEKINLDVSNIFKEVIQEK